MSFRFNWPEFDPKFYTEAKTQLETALNKERKSKHIADHIFVKELNMGSFPPELEILEICALTTDYFRGIFKLTYRGDAYLELQTKVQANPLYNPSSSSVNEHASMARHGRPTIVAANQPLVIPMLLRISDVQLNGIIVLAVSQTKGVTLVFKNDALRSLTVSSTFDIVASIKSFLQQQIESQLRTFLQETLPLVVHDFSLRHIQDQQQKQALLERQQQQKRRHHISTSKQSSLSSSSSDDGVDSVSPSSRLSALHHDCQLDHLDTFINCNDDDSGIYTIPDLSSPSSISGCSSDTSSICPSYDSTEEENDMLLYSSMAAMTFNSDSLDSQDRLFHSTTRSKPSTPMSRYLHIPANDKKKDSYLGQRYSLFHNWADCTPPIPSPCSSVYTSDDGGDNDDPCCYGDDFSIRSLYPSVSSQSLQTILPRVYFDAPIQLPTSRRPHQLLQRMVNRANSSQTLSFAHADSDSHQGLVHKTCALNDIGKCNSVLKCQRHRTKVPKRRIIRWQS